VSPGGTSFETSLGIQGFWWVRHARNGQFSGWVQAPWSGSSGGGGEPEGGETLFPVIDSVTQTTDADTCAVGSPVNLRIQITAVGSSLMTLQRSVDGGAFATIDAAVPAGALIVNRTEMSGFGYQYQIKYNAVSPEQYSAVSSSVSATCNLV
jgi:hypothetical protein